MKKARMNISHSRFILFKLKIFGEIVTTYKKITFCPEKSWENCTNIFQKKKIQEFCKTAKKIQDFSRVWQPWTVVSDLATKPTTYQMAFCLLNKDLSGNRYCTIEL